jgi:hypothetical protein
MLVFHITLSAISHQYNFYRVPILTVMDNTPATPESFIIRMGSKDQSPVTRKLTCMEWHKPTFLNIAQANRAMAECLASFRKSKMQFVPMTVKEGGRERKTESMVAMAIPSLL